MTPADWFTFFGILVWMAILAWILYNGITKHIERLSTRVDLMSRARVGKVGSQMSDHQNPIVDAKARTTIRDTDDLPRTGRMAGQFRKSKMVGGDYEDTQVDRNTDDV